MLERASVKEGESQSGLGNQGKMKETVDHGKQDLKSVHYRNYSACICLKEVNDLR